MITILLVILGLFVIISVNNVIICVLCSMMKKKNKSNVVDIENNRQALDFGTRFRKKVRNCLSGYIIYTIKIIGKIPSNSLRVFILKNVYRMDIGKNVSIHSDFVARHPWNITIGNGSVIGDYVYLDGRKGINIGNNVNISTGVCVWTMQHDVNDPQFRVNNNMGKVIIEDRVWLSCRVIVLPKTRIGKGSVVAAGAVVTKDCSEYKIYGGIPAKPIGDRNKELIYEFNKFEDLWFV